MRSRVIAIAGPSGGAIALGLIGIGNDDGVSVINNHRRSYEYIMTLEEV